MKRSPNIPNLQDRILSCMLMSIIGEGAGLLRNVSVVVVFINALS